MGKLIWHEWARLMAITASIYMLWASLWAFAYRKFFWDFVGGTLGPTGLIPNPTAQVFNKMIITISVLQSFTLILSMGTLALEYPLPFVKGTMIHRSHIARIAMYLSASMIGFLVYQTFDCALYFFIVAMAYMRSMMLRGTIGVEVKKGQSAA